MNVAVAPALTVTLVGCVVTVGAKLTVSVAAFDVAVPAALVNTARYCVPFSAAVVGGDASASSTSPRVIVA